MLRLTPSCPKALRNCQDQTRARCVRSWNRQQTEQAVGAVQQFHLLRSRISQISGDFLFRRIDPEATDIRNSLFSLAIHATNRRRRCVCKRLAPTLKLWRDESLRFYHHRCPGVGDVIKTVRALRITCATPVFIRAIGCPSLVQSVAGRVEKRGHRDAHANVPFL